MTVELYFPLDEIDRQNPNFDLAADYLELTAFFSDKNRTSTKSLINATEIGSEDEYKELEEEIAEREKIISGAVSRIDDRQYVLDTAYPFALDADGDFLEYVAQEPSYGQAAYLLSLVLSNLKSISPILDGSQVYPSEEEILELRQYFQYFATASLAAEVNGRAWSFGHPRPDSTGFHAKITEIWDVLRDGKFQPGVGAPDSPQDDQIDIFAARLHRDRLPGFLFAAGQVATGKNWKDKSLRGHLSKVFFNRWFSPEPVTEMLCYHIIPFARPDDKFFDDCRVLGNVLHRLRVPNRVAEAKRLHEAGESIEAFDQLCAAVEWVKTYSTRGTTAI